MCFPFACDKFLKGVKEFKGVMVKKGYQAKRRNSGNVFIGLVINE